MQTLIESPTIAGLAEQIRMLKRRSHSVSEAPWTSLVSIQGGNSREPFFLIPGGVGSYMEFLIYGRMAQYVVANSVLWNCVPALRIENSSRTLAQKRWLPTTFGKCARFKPNGPYLLVGECVGGLWPTRWRNSFSLKDSSSPLALLDTSRPTRARQFAFCGDSYATVVSIPGRLPRRIVHHWRTNQPTAAWGNAWTSLR